MPRGGYKVNQMRPTSGTLQRTSKKYIRVVVTFRRKQYKVSHLVALAFLGLRPEGYDVSHDDEDSMNNTSKNLLYETRKANLNRPGIKAYHSSVCRQKMTA